MKTAILLLLIIIITIGLSIIETTKMRAREAVMKIIAIIVTIMTLKMGRMTDWKRKNLLIRTRNWSSLYAFEKYKHYKGNN